MAGMSVRQVIAVYGAWKQAAGLLFLFLKDVSPLIQKASFKDWETAVQVCVWIGSKKSAI